MRKKRGQANRPPNICSRGPYRRKREHVEDLVRWDARDYIDQALPDENEAWNYEDDDADALHLSAFEGYAEVDPRDPIYSVFQVNVELKPGHPRTLQLYRGSRFPSTPLQQRNHWWYWICPECKRRCRYLYTLRGSSAITFGRAP